MTKQKTKEELMRKFEKLKIPKKKEDTNISCNYCNYCDACYSCISCDACYYCDYCLRLTNGILCKGLRFDYGDENAYNKEKYWVLNKEVSKKEFEEIKKIMKNEVR